VLLELSGFPPRFKEYSGSLDYLRLWTLAVLKAFRRRVIRVSVQLVNKKWWVFNSE